MRYELSRGSIDKDRHVICQEDQFYSLVPAEIRQRGPWQVIDRGDTKALRPEYRVALAVVPQEVVPGQA